MKFRALFALIVIVGLIAYSDALPARKRMARYRRPAQYRAAPQRLMYVQYVHPSRSLARTQAAEALVAGETVATSTYLKDCDPAEGSTAGTSVGIDIVAGEAHNGEDVSGSAGGDSVHSVAEAYPNGDSLSGQVEVSPDENAIFGNGGNGNGHGADADASFGANGGFDADVSNGVGASAGFGANGGNGGAFGANGGNGGAFGANGGSGAGFDIDADVGAASGNGAVNGNGVKGSHDYNGNGAAAEGAAGSGHISPPNKNYLPSKKVIVELEHSAESELEEDESGVALAQESEDEDDHAVGQHTQKSPARLPNGRKQMKGGKNGSSKKGQRPLPAGTFFPIDFGGTSGGAIAIANSLSTGEGGSATSHAIAYGAPDASRARVRPRKVN